MRAKERPRSIFAEKLDEHHRSVNSFWRESGLKEHGAISFETVRRLIYKDDRSVNAASLAMIMHALGFARSEIIEELKRRGDGYLYRLIYEPGEELSAEDREGVDSLRSIGARNPTMRTALLHFAEAVDDALPAHTEGAGNGPLHVLAGAETDESARPGFVHALEVLINDLNKRCGTPEEVQRELDARNGEGKTPLISACSAGNEEAALLLLREGASLAATDGRGRGVMDYAHGHRLKKVLEAVRERDPAVFMDYWMART